MKKLRQISDNIHGAIYLSELESSLMSTPFFNRLHDVYQNSTVYLTYPTNRTKRYEHSIGTMQIASQLFMSSVANAENNVQDELINQLDENFKVIIAELPERGKKGYSVFYNEDKEANKYFAEEVLSYQDTIKKISITKKLNDSALNHFIPFCLKNDYHFFLYQCLLESIRIVALFHDAGHPPYSHVIEKSLDNILKKIQKNSEKTTQAKKFIEILTESTKLHTDIPLIITDIQKKKKQRKLHESIGISMIERAFSSCKRLYFNPQEYECNIYFITIIEFVFAIYFEKTPYWERMHSYIDSTFDADRLDYVLRDSLNSGVSFATYSYKRVVESVKLVIDPKQKKTKKNCILKISFPRKIISSLDDILETRYKIYSEINHHHRSSKMGLLLAKAVENISLEFLENKEKGDRTTTEFDHISALWLAIEKVIYEDDTSCDCARWNDSWLISHLHARYSFLQREKKTQIANTSGILEKKHLTLLALEEVLVNKKNYHTIIKRNADLCKFYTMIQEKMQKNSNLVTLIETLKVGDNEDDDMKLFYIDLVLTEPFSFEILTTYILTIAKLRNIIESACIQAVKDFKSKNTKIIDYLFENIDINIDFEPVFLYNENNFILDSYEFLSGIRDKLEILKNNTVDFLFYLCFSEDTKNVWHEIEQFKKLLSRIIAKKLVEEIEERLWEFQELKAEALIKH